MTKQLLEREPIPTTARSGIYLSGNLCRCAAYPEIVAAVKRAARACGQPPWRRESVNSCTGARRPNKRPGTKSGGGFAGTSTAGAPPWYRALDHRQWNTLVASNLGWLFDGYEAYALVLVVGGALHQLLPRRNMPASRPMPGWSSPSRCWAGGSGGMLGGVLADYIGRKRTMIFSILGYSLLTGISASRGIGNVRGLRFLVGMPIGSEWATGTSMTAEMWPDNARGKGAGLIQCGLGLGFFLAVRSGFSSPRSAPMRGATCS